jgi:hypothetical protein
MHLFLKIFSIVGLIGAWSSQALTDGKVTAEEALSLGLQLAAVLGLPTEIVVPLPKP